MVTADKAYLACSILMLGALGPSGLFAAETETQPAAPSNAEMRVIDQKNWLTVSQAVGKDEDTPQNRKLADRRNINDAFQRYKTAGGLAPRYRFARAYASTFGFTGAVAGRDDEEGLSRREAAVLRSHPAAFDLICQPRAKPADDDKESRKAKNSKDSEEDAPQSALPLRFSVDVAAGLWRPENAFIQPMHVEKDGKLLARWQVDLNRSTWGEPTYDRISHDYIESISTTDPVSKKVSRAVVRAKCKVAPYSKLFGAPKG